MVESSMSSFQTNKLEYNRGYFQKESKQYKCVLNFDKRMKYVLATKVSRNLKNSEYISGERHSS